MNEAVVSRCGLYRYMLRRGDAPRCAFVLLNPSTADAEKDDATSRKLMVLARLWGFAGYDLFNIGAGRATKPPEWLRMIDPLGPDNDFYLQIAAGYDRIVVGWGNHAPFEFVSRAVQILVSNGSPLWCLKINANGSPMHPLYVPNETPLRLWPGLDNSVN